MDMDASSAAEATVEPEGEAQRHVARRAKSETQPEESDQKAEECSRFSYSITARCRERVAQAEGLKRATTKWCQKDTLAIQDIENIVPNMLGFKSAFIRSGECSCTMCKSIAELKVRCHRFIKCKDKCAS